MTDAALQDFWDRCRGHVTGLPEELPEAWAFGATPEHARELLQLVLDGTKTGTASSLWDYEASGDPLPETGDLSIILDEHGHPQAVIRTTDVTTVPFDEVTAEHAYAEGEGDRTLKHWREVHEQFWREHSENPRGYEPNMPVLCERFELVWAEPAPVPLPIRTERLMLRLHRDDDLDWVFRTYSNPDVARYLPFDPFSEDDARTKLEQWAGETDFRGSTGALRLIIEADGSPIGNVLLKSTDPLHRVAEIGWVLSPEAGGKGYAREAASAVVDLAFSHYGVNRVVARLVIGNVGSAKLAESLGMTREAQLREDFWNNGNWSDTLIYGLLASDRLVTATPEPAVS